MANEITYAVSMSVSSGGAAINSGTLSDTIDMLGVDMGTVTQSIGTSNEALDVPADVGVGNDSLGSPVTGAVHLIVKNLDATNYVEIFKDSGNSHLLSKLKPGESCSFRRIPYNALYARANTAAVQIQFWICEE